MIYFQFPQIPQVRCVFHKRSKQAEFSELAGNFSFQVNDKPERVKKLRAAFYDELKARGLKEWTECRQVHGVELIINPTVTAPFDENASLQEGDGLCTNKKGLGLIIKTADCQPVLVADKSGTHIMALHIGWRGNRLGFAQQAIVRFCAQFALKPENLCAVRGPSLGPEKSRFSDFEQEWGKDFEKWFDKDAKCMNLWQLTKDQLLEAGLRKEDIFGIDVCTHTHCEDFFSYRANKNTGRQASVIWIER